MLDVVSLEKAREIARNAFSQTAFERVSLQTACGRVLARAVTSSEGIPPFTRSSVDGYAVRAADTFGCSDALPMLLTCTGSVRMGATPSHPVEAGSCQELPTGGMLPEGADAVVMVEHAEAYGDGTIGILKAASPGDNLVFAHDDTKTGEVLIPAGRRLQPHHIGALASMGIAEVEAARQLRVGIVSTGDELVAAHEQPHGAQIRDVNAPMLAACVRASGAEPVSYGIVADRLEALDEALGQAARACDVVLVSGGSSVGERDNTSRALAARGRLLFHGIALKPGKPTIAADLDGVPAFGLPGHPVAAYFVFLELVRPLLEHLSGLHTPPPFAWDARLSARVPSNHGRAEIVPVALREGDDGLAAEPVRSKSGLIALLSRTDGYLLVERDREGLARGARVQVHPYWL